MPYLKIQTNVHVGDGAKSQLLTSLSKAIAEALGKPESYVMIALEDNVPMLFGGNDDPTAYLELKSLELPEDQTTVFSAALCSAIENELAIPLERTYIEFAGPARHMWGWSGRTF
ncbi:phenylpyruvate tautomerase MIF-related protein [Pseudomonadota bacterium]